MDSWLVDKLDAAMTWAQQRGVSLVAVHCWVMGLVLFFEVAARLVAGMMVSMVICGAMWGAALHAYLRWAERSRDYRENMRLAQKLNAEALGHREGGHTMRVVCTPLLCAITVLVDVPVLFAGDIVLGLLWASSTLCVILSFYLNTSTFLAGGVPRSRAVPHGVRADG